MLCCDGNSFSSESVHRLAIDNMFNDIVDALALCRTRYVGNCSSVGHDVRFEHVVMVRGVYFYDIDVGRQAFS